MLDWAAKEADVDMDKLGERMCAEHAVGRIRAILLWPSIHRKLLEMCLTHRDGMRGVAPLSERLKALLAEEHGCSIRTAARLIAAGNRTATLNEIDRFSATTHRCGV